MLQLLHTVPLHWPHRHTHIGVSQSVVSRRAILSENEFTNIYTSQADPYDQYEVAVPVEVLGDCMAKVQGLLTTRVAT